jgi:hypothetical protein
MDGAAALVRLNRRLLERFSTRSVGALRAALPLLVALPYLEPFLSRNLEKEARKDALVIACAREAVAAGALPEAAQARGLLAGARAIDREFFASVARMPLRFEVPYGRVEPLRLKRIELGLSLSGRILRAWSAHRRLREALPRAELARDVRAILLLYCEETAALSRGVQLPALLAPLRERLAVALLRLMRETAERLAQDIAAQKRR